MIWGTWLVFSVIALLSLICTGVLCLSVSDSTSVSYTAYVGCYEDNKGQYVGSRILIGVTKIEWYYMTVDYCSERCRNYVYAGLEQKNQCFCGNKMKDEFSKKQESHCDMKCGGNQNQTCGGNNHISIYKVPMKAFTVTPGAAPSVNLTDKSALPTGSYIGVGVAALTVIIVIIVAIVHHYRKRKHTVRFAQCSNPGYTDVTLSEISTNAVQQPQSMSPTTHCSDDVYAQVIKSPKEAGLVQSNGSKSAAHSDQGSHAGIGVNQAAPDDKDMVVVENDLYGT